MDEYLIDHPDDPVTTARNDLIHHINAGVDLVLFDGHGSWTTWSQQALLTTQDIQLLNNQQPFLLSPLSCYTTYYELPSTNTLAHQLLMSGNNGTVAIHGAMVLSQYSSNQTLSTHIIKDMIDNKSTLGEAIRRTKIDKFDANDDSIINWTLLGDPTITF